MSHLYKVTFVDGREDLFANYVQFSKTGGSLHIIQGVCDCYKNSCNCLKEFYIPYGYVKTYELGTYAGPGAIERPTNKEKRKSKYNFELQYYKGIKLQLINRGYGKGCKAKRFTLNGTNQNVWIPNKHLTPDGTIKNGENIDYVFRKAQRQLELAGYTEPIIGIKRRTIVTAN